MNRYTIYCTEEQTKKALELGAPIEVTKRFEPLVNRKYIADLSNYSAIIIPTAEQMISWLETHEYFKSITFLNTALENEQNAWIGFVNFTDNDKYPIAVEPYSSRPEATLAVIDAALEYLTKNKGNEV